MISYSITSSAMASNFRGNVEAKSLSGFEVDDEFEFCGPSKPRAISTLEFTTLPKKIHGMA